MRLAHLCISLGEFCARESPLSRVLLMCASEPRCASTFRKPPQYLRGGDTTQDRSSTNMPAESRPVRETPARSPLRPAPQLCPPAADPPEPMLELNRIQGNILPGFMKD